MRTDEALNVVESLLQGDRLNLLQRQVFCKAWEECSYGQIAQDCGYELGYVKQVGAEVWQRLSIALSTKVTKKNLHRVLHRVLHQQIHQEIHQESHQDTCAALAATPQFSLESGASESRMPESTDTISPSSLPSPLSSPPFSSLAKPQCDWGAAADVANFLGRRSELTQLQQWIIEHHCRLVGIVGMGGMGKTTLAAHLARQIQHEFDYVIWRSLRNAPPLVDLLDDLLQFLGDSHSSYASDAIRSDHIDRKLHELLSRLQRYRCLVILDNGETILQQGSYGGYYLPGYEGYGQLWQCLGESAHHSTVMLTSREKPKELAALEGISLPVRSLSLNGLSAVTGQELFRFKGDFSGSEETWEILVNHYAGNPLALKMVAVVIQDWFGGAIEPFLACLQDGSSVFGDIQDLLTQQISRLSTLEQQVMDWLAIARTPLTLSQLRACFIPTVSLGDVLAALTSLERRCLIDKTSPSLVGDGQVCFTLQPAVMEYVTGHFIQTICEELQEISSRLAHTTEINLQTLRFITHALILAQSEDYIRETQVRLILTKVTTYLQQNFSTSDLVSLFQSCLQTLRGRSPDQVAYAVGNIVNLLQQLGIDLSGWDFSDLPVRNAYLRGVTLHGVNFTGADLSQSVFTETFSQVLAVAFSPDGSLLATGDVNQEIHLWQVADGKKLLTLRVDEGWVWDLAFSPDGKMLASAANRSVKLWQVKTGTCLTTLNDYTDRVFSVSFSPDGQYLATGSEDHRVRVWSVRTGKLLWVLTGHDDEVRSVTFSPLFAFKSGGITATKAGYILASASYDGTVRLWDVEQGTCVQVWRGHQGWVWQVAFSPDGQTLASGGSDRTLRLWDVATGTVRYVLEGHAQPVRTVAFSPDGRTVLSGSDDGMCCLWNYRTGQHLKVIAGHRSWISAVVYSPDGHLFATGSEDQSVKLWDSRTHLCVKTLQGYSDGVWSVAIAPAGDTLASGSQDRLIRLWNLATGELQRTLKGHTNWVWAVAFNPGETLLASASEDHTMRLWDLATGRTIQVLSGHRDAAIAVLFTCDGQHLVSASLDGTIRLWQVATGNCVQILQGHEGGVWCLAISLDGEWLASGSQDQTVKIWHLSTCQCIQTLTGHQTWIRSVAFSPDGKQVISGSADGSIKQWHWQTGICDRTLAAHSGPVLSLAMHPNGKSVTSCSTDALVKWWDLATGTCLDVKNGHQRWIRTLAYNADGSLLTSGSQDQTIKLWHRQSARYKSHQTLRIPRPYEDMAIAHTTGLTPAQRSALILLGAVEQPFTWNSTAETQRPQRILSPQRCITSFHSTQELVHQNGNTLPNQ